MKPVLSLLAAALFALAAVTPAAAQVFRPETVSGALVGGLAGAVIGHNDGRHGWEGAAYGAAAGALVGTAVGHAREHRAHERTQPSRPAHVHAGWSSRPRWHSGYHHDSRWSPYRHVGYRSQVWVSPSWAYSGWSRPYPYYSYSRPYAYDSYYSYPSVRPRYAHRGALLGGLAGAIIGHNDGRHGWEGAAYGIGAGYLLGSIADARAARWADEGAVVASPAYAPAPAQTAPAAPVTIINNYYAAPASTPMTSANRVFGR
jgi:uncharacterized protein YcfJ